MPTRHCSFRQYPNLPFLFPVPSPVSPFPCPKYDNLRFLQWCMFCSLEYCGYIFMLSSSLLRYLLFSCHLPIKACLDLLLLCFIELQILHFLTNCDNPESNKTINVTLSAVCAYSWLSDFSNSPNVADFYYYTIMMMCDQWSLITLL